MRIFWAYLMIEAVKLHHPYGWAFKYIPNDVTQCNHTEIK